MSQFKKHFSTVCLSIMMLAGLCVLLYPTISNWLNEQEQTRALVTYNKTVVEMNSDESDALIEEAREYNRKLSELQAPFKDYDQISGYDEILNVSGSGIIGYVSIPMIQVELPIYHGTDESVLDLAAGHLEGTSIPVGGKNTHAVISAHCGLPSAKLFTDLDKLVVGDMFTINVLDQIYTYQIEEILTVLPHEVNNITIEPDSDYVTLMTCTPYGVNTHRLLLRSKRIEIEQTLDIRVTADAMKIDTLLVIFVIALPLFIIALCLWIFVGKWYSVNKRSAYFPAQLSGRYAFRDTREKHM